MFRHLKKNKKRKNPDHKESKINPPRKLIKLSPNCEIPLLDDILQYTFFGYLESDDAKKLATVSPSFAKSCQKQLTAIFLQHIVRGEQNEAENMLKANPDLLLCKGNVTDYSNRTFHNINAFQYALWALDYHMWKMIRKYLPKEKQKSQLKELEENGVTYTKPVFGDQKEKVVTEKHYDFSLITALDEYVKKFNARTWDQRKAVWCKNVGGAQRNVPAHIAQEYCRPDRSFDPIPEFKEPILPRVVDVHTYAPNSDFSWFSSDSGLASTFAISRMAAVEAWCTYGIVCDAAAAMDLKAVTALCEIRTKQFERLKKELLTHVATPCSFQR